MQIQRAARRILDGKLSTRRQQRKSFSPADVACAYDRVWWLRSEQNSKEERNVTQQPLSRWHPGGIASRWPCKGIAVPLRVCWCSEYKVKASDDLQTEFGVMGFDPYCQMLLGFDSERLPGWTDPTETNEKRDVKWPLGLISSSSSWLPWAGKRRHVFTCVGISEGEWWEKREKSIPTQRSVFQSQQYIQSSQRRGPRPREMLKALDFWKMFGWRTKKKLKHEQFPCNNSNAVRFAHRVSCNTVRFSCVRYCSPMCLQNLDPVGGAYFGLKAPPSSLLVRPQQPPARLMLLWARSASSRSHSDWLCARSGRTICTGGVEDVGCEEMVRNRWLRFRKKSPLPPSPKLPFRRTMRVLPVLAGLDLWLYSSCDRWDA